jgi:hypothetical protein
MAAPAMAILAIPVMKIQTAPPLELFARITSVLLELQGLLVLQLMTAPLMQRFAWMDYSTFASVSTLSVCRVAMAVVVQTAMFVPMTATVLLQAPYVSTQASVALIPPAAAHPASRLMTV